MVLTLRKNPLVVRMQDFLLERIIAPVIVTIAFVFFSVAVMFLKTFFPDSISGTYLQLFF
ncbi:MAG: hypothetical protein AAFW70_00360 [Cyanobacteria bacterium J06635_10]